MAVHRTNVPCGMRIGQHLQSDAKAVVTHALPQPWQNYALLPRSQHGGICIDGQARLTPALYREATDEAERQSQRQQALLQLKGGGNDGLDAHGKA